MQNAWTVMTTRIEAANWSAAVADIERRYKSHKARIQNAYSNISTQAKTGRDEAILALTYIQKTLQPAIRDQEAHQRALDCLSGKITDNALIGTLQTRNTQLLQNIQDIRSQLQKLEQQKNALQAEIKTADDKFEVLMQIARQLRTTRRGKEWDALWKNFGQAASAFWQDFSTNKIVNAYIAGMSQVSARIAQRLALLLQMPIQNAILTEAERREWFAASAQVYEALASMTNALIQEDMAVNRAGIQTPVAGSTRTKVVPGNTADLTNALNILRARAAAARNCA